MKRRVELIQIIDADGRDFSHDLQIDLPPTPLLIQGDLTRVTQVIGNVLANAVKYTDDGGRIGVSAKLAGALVEIRIRDNGIGIPAEHIPRLTERFYRVDAGRSRDRGGSGLGLAIVKHALQRHGGWLEVASTEGKGSTFTCHFPSQRVLTDTQREAASA